MKRLAFLFLLLTPCLAASKAVFSPQLQAQLDSLLAQAVVEAFLVVKNRAPIGLLKASLPDATRQKLHTEVVTALKEKAASTQTELLNFLAVEQSAGRVLEYKSYWIDNYVFVRATKATLERLAGRDDLAELYENPRIELVAQMEEIVAPVERSASLRDTGRAEPNLVVIGCRQVWKRGLTGKGRVVCTIDTGVEGVHKALRSRWRGRRPGVTSKEAWFDPVQSFPIPHTYGPINSTTRSHGTHVTGIICGIDTSLTINGTDTVRFVVTIGVAPEADWIAAAVVDNGASGAGILDALQWAADPDGHPNTIEDVPDVVNNSWAFPTTGSTNNLTCNSFFWQTIDNLEAAGAVAVFAAGNSGPGAKSIGNPADRGTSPFSSFAVGNFDLNSVAVDSDNPDSVVGFTGAIEKTSSRGPTECGPDSLKPEVAAPGTNIYSSVFGNQLDSLFWTGTSMAAPHVAGAVAILRQYNPNATVDTIKWALANSATDIEIPGPDSLSGFGLINIPKALSLIPSNRGIHLFIKKDRVFDPFGQGPYSGGAFEIHLKLGNNGVDTAHGLYGKLSPADAKSAVLADSAFFGQAAPGDTASNAGRTFKIQLASGLLPGERFRFTLNLFGEAGFSQTLNLIFTVGQKLDKAIYTHGNGNVEFTVSNYGQYGLEQGGIETRSMPGFLVGQGFKRKTEPNATRVFEANFMAGVNDSSVSNTASNEFCCFPSVPPTPDADFAVHPGGNLQVFEPGLSGGVETFSIFDDRQAKNPFGLIVSQRSFSFDAPGQDNFAILEFTLRNGGLASLDNLQAGLFLDFNFFNQLSQFIGDKVGFERAYRLGYQYNEISNAYRGVASADTINLSSFRGVRIFPTVVDGFTLAEKWALLTPGFTDTTITIATDAAILAAKGPLHLFPGESLKIAFALVAARTLDSLKIYTQAARTAYSRITSPKGDLDSDGYFTATDVVLEINCFFLSPGNCPLNLTDLDCNGVLQLADIVLLLNRVFLGISPPCP